MTGEVEAESNLLTEVLLCPFQEHANSLLIILSSWETFQFITISKYGQTIFAGTEVTKRMSLLGRSTSLAGLFCLAFLMFGGTVRIQVLRCHFIHKRLSIKTSQISFLDQIPVLFPILIISIIFPLVGKNICRAIARRVRGPAWWCSSCKDVHKEITLDVWNLMKDYLQFFVCVDKLNSGLFSGSCSPLCFNVLMSFPTTWVRMNLMITTATLSSSLALDFWIHPLLWAA